MNEHITALAREQGFSDILFLNHAVLSRWREQASAQDTLCGMEADTRHAYPKARSVILLVRRYSPYAGNVRVLPYYIAENSGYFAAKAFAAALAKTGAYAKSAWLPSRALAIANGAGVQGKNGLLALPFAGTRISLFTVATDAAEPLEYDVHDPSCPPECNLCQSVCPTGAISDAGLDVTKCLRYHMNGAAHPACVLERMESYLGCDKCQAICPKNRLVSAVEPPESVAYAFDMCRLLEGDTRDARTLVGRNMTGGGKLTVEAIAFAAREGKYEEYIRRCLVSEHPAVRDAARWALERYFV